MKKEPVLVIMAAGMGSRYGGLKQIDPVDEDGHIIIDFSICDAYQAGFEEVIFIIKKENEKDFSDFIKPGFGDLHDSCDCVCRNNASTTDGNSRHFKQIV